METKRRSRYVDPPGEARLVDGDIPFLKLLCPGAAARQPWGYSYLPSSYFSALLDRGKENTKDRLAELRKRPHYLTLPDQPRNTFRNLIYQLGVGAKAELAEEGIRAIVTQRAVPHELLACLIAASFEFASREYGGPLEILPPKELGIYPDWMPFRYRGRTIFIEADMGTATNAPTRGAESTSSNIARKFERYLAVLHNKQAANPFFAFVTCKPGRTTGWIETFKDVVEKHDYDHDCADNFGFTSIDYNRFFDAIPPPSSWVATQPWLQAGPKGKYPEFRFIPEVSI